MVTLESFGAVSQSAKRNRSLLIDAMDPLVAHFIEPSRSQLSAHARGGSLPANERTTAVGNHPLPMGRSLSRAECLSENRKSPGAKTGYHVWCDLPQGDQKDHRLAAKTQHRYSRSPPTR